MLIPRISFAAVLAALLAIFSLAHQEPTALLPVGERLVYKIQWDPPWYLFFLPKMEAGEVSVELEGEAEYEGRKAYKIVMAASSSGTLTRLLGVRVDDEFVFFTEPQTLCTMGASERIREGKRKRQIDVRYFRESRQLHIREVDEAPDPPIVRKDEMKDGIPECVHDPLSALHLFRRLPLRKGFSHTIMLAYNDRIREVRGEVEKQEMVDTVSGKMAAWKINTTALMGGLFREGGQFRVWFSANDKKIPLQFDVRVRLGHVFGKLKSVE